LGKGTRMGATALARTHLDTDDEQEPRIRTSANPLVIADCPICPARTPESQELFELGYTLAQAALQARKEAR
jgi:hypothetical protein